MTDTIIARLFNGLRTIFGFNHVEQKFDAHGFADTFVSFRRYIVSCPPDAAERIYESVRDLDGKQLDAADKDLIARRVEDIEKEWAAAHATLATRWHKPPRIFDARFQSEPKSTLLLNLRMF